MKIVLDKRYRYNNIWPLSQTIFVAYLLCDFFQHTVGSHFNKLYRSMYYTKCIDVCEEPIHINRERYIRIVIFFQCLFYQAYLRATRCAQMKGISHDMGYSMKAYEFVTVERHG